MCLYRSQLQEVATSIRTLSIAFSVQLGRTYSAYYSGFRNLSSIGDHSTRLLAVPIRWKQSAIALRHRNPVYIYAEFPLPRPRAASVSSSMVRPGETLRQQRIGNTQPVTSSEYTAVALMIPKTPHFCAAK